MRHALGALLASATLALLAGCSSGGEVQASDLKDYQNAGLPAGQKAPAEDPQAER